MPLKIGKGTNPEVSHLWVLFFPCVLCKATAYIVTKKLNMNHQAQKGFWVMFVGIPQHQKGVLFTFYTNRRYYLHTMFILKRFSSALSYTSQPCAEEKPMQQAVSWINYATSSREQTGNIIMFSKFEGGGGVLSENHDDT